MSQQALSPNFANMRNVVYEVCHTNLHSRVIHGDGGTSQTVRPAPCKHLDEKLILSWYSVASLVCLGDEPPARP